MTILLTFISCSRPGNFIEVQTAGKKAAISGDGDNTSAPDAPDGVSGTAGDRQVSLTWTVPLNDGGADITDYVVMYSSNAGSSWDLFVDDESDSPAVTVTGLTNGQAYIFNVAAVNAVGMGTFTTSDEMIPATSPGQPTSLTATAGNQQVTLTWIAPSDSGGRTITDYLVQYKSASAGEESWQVFNDGISAVTSTTVTGLSKNETYVFRIAAVNQQAQGDYSEQSTIVNPLGSFISTWKTDNISAGSSASNQIKLPLESDGTYNFTVDWGDGTQNTITSWDDPNTTHTYSSAGTYTIIINGNINGFRFNNGGDHQKITNISEFGGLRLGNNGSYFYGASNLTITATDALDLTGTTDLSKAFRDCSSLTTAPSMASWITSAVIDMNAMFLNAVAFNQDISNWDTSNVTNMESMFDVAEAFNQDIGNWDVSNVTNMAYMFYYTPAFNKPIGNWNTSNVTTMACMFCYSETFNQDISNWDTSNVTNMMSMFAGATIFNKNIGSWNVSNVTDMSGMFQNATHFNQPIGSWDVSKVTQTHYMFYGAHAFNQDIGGWNTANFSILQQMFYEASAFNQDISSWNVTNVTNLNSLLLYATSFSRSNYDALLLGWSAQDVKTGLNFSAGSTKYSQSAAVIAARSVLTTATGSGGKGWTITDGGGEAIVPNAPSNLTGSAGNSQVVLSWTASSDTGGSAIDDYVIQHSSSNGDSWTLYNDGTSTSTSATVTGLTNGTSYIFRVAAKNSVGTGDFSTNSSSVTPVVAAATPCTGDCYTNAQGLEIGTERAGPDQSTLTLQYANGSSGFKIWREKDGNRILNATGLIENGWQRQLTRTGLAFAADLTNQATVDKILGRACPENVFINYENMTVTDRCLYYFQGFSVEDNAGAYSLNYFVAQGTLGEDYLGNWDDPASGNGTTPSWYEGNVKTCADHGFRTMTLYESHATGIDLFYDYPPTDAMPTFSSFGVPINSWTSSAMTAYSSGYWLSSDGLAYNHASHETQEHTLVCVLPSHGFTVDPPPPPPDGSDDSGSSGGSGSCSSAELPETLNMRYLTPGCICDSLSVPNVEIQLTKTESSGNVFWSGSQSFCSPDNAGFEMRVDTTCNNGTWSFTASVPSINAGLLGTAECNVTYTPSTPQAEISSPDPIEFSDSEIQVSASTLPPPPTQDGGGDSTSEEPLWCVSRTIFYATAWTETRAGLDPCIDLCGAPMSGDYCSCWEPNTDGNAWGVDRGACSN